MLYRFVALIAIMATAAVAQDNESPISAAALGLPPAQSAATGVVSTSSRLNTVDMRFSFSGTAAGPNADGEEVIQAMYLHRGTPGAGGDLIMQIVDSPQSSPGSTSFQLNGVTPQGVSYTDELLQGAYYVNLTTVQFPTGELAGQIGRGAISVEVRPGDNPGSGAASVFASLSTVAASIFAAAAAIM